MVKKVMKITMHCWNGHGGPRGLVTHVWDSTFKQVKDYIDANGLGEYTFTFERTADLPSQIGHPDAAC
jgi:hypothetical protein